jgi:hypothetical protein
MKDPPSCIGEDMKDLYPCAAEDMKYLSRALVKI